MKGQCLAAIMALAMLVAACSGKAGDPIKTHEQEVLDWEKPGSFQMIEINKDSDGASRFEVIDTRTGQIFDCGVSQEGSSCVEKQRLEPE